MKTYSLSKIKLLIPALIAVLAIFASCSSETTAPDPQAPDPVTGPTPTVGSAGLSNVLDLTWKASKDPQGDPVTYDIYVGVTQTPLLVAEDLDVTTFRPPGLYFDRKHYWRVDAKDNHGNVTRGPLWNFTVGPCPEDPGQICTFAGTGVNGLGAEGELPRDTKLYWPVDIIFDNADSPYLVDWNNHRILGIDPSDHCYAIIGGRFGDAPDGIANEIGLNHPTHAAFNAQGELILSAWHNSLIKRVDATGYAKTFCGNGQRSYGGDGGPAANAITDLPSCILIHNNGDIYFTDQANQIIRRIYPNPADNNILYIETVAGTPKSKGWVGDGGPATSAWFNFDVGQNADPDGKICFSPDQTKIYVADRGNHRIRVFDLNTNTVDTYAGLKGQSPVPGFEGDGGPAVDAKMRSPRDVATDADGNLFIADTGNNCIRVVLASNGNIYTIAGTPLVNGSDEFDGKNARDALLSDPFGVAIDGSGNLWIADFGNALVRVVYEPLANVTP